MEMTSNEEMDDNKMDTIKLRLLEMEADNVVQKESNPAMIEKVKRMVMTEVEKK